MTIPNTGLNGNNVVPFPGRAVSISGDGLVSVDGILSGLKFPTGPQIMPEADPLIAKQRLAPIMAMLKLQSRIEEALAQLSPLQKTVILMLYPVLGGSEQALSHKEIARMLNKNPSAEIESELLERCGTRIITVADVEKIEREALDSLSVNPARTRRAA